MPRTPFNKIALDVNDQMATLVKRGLLVKDMPSAMHELEHIGYYRLTGYTRPFRIGGSGATAENFRPGTTFETVLDRYTFDESCAYLSWTQ